ncbi:unnamed protein product [Echinostoma caproni]|uniref:Transposase n=1 Tax=Echinostoma caproni TaxID=27848 RepID=A0A183APU7_9TREM|nr:unnamed protein product [Echinostoma caproni]
MSKGTKHESGGASRGEAHTRRYQFSSKPGHQDEHSSIALNHLEFRSDLDALHTLKSIARWLPAEMQTAWATGADRIEKRNREATFDELAQFTGCKSRIANSRFG